MRLRKRVGRLKEGSNSLNNISRVLCILLNPLRLDSRVKNCSNIRKVVFAKEIVVLVELLSSLLYSTNKTLINRFEVSFLLYNLA